MVSNYPISPIKLWNKSKPIDSVRKVATSKNQVLRFQQWEIMPVHTKENRVGKSP